MSIDDVLADKQLIIEELTARLRQVGEGDSKDEGLGLRIVTVQIKEAVVSSARVWDSLPRAFRAERAKVARLAELSHEAEVREREAEEEKKDAMIMIEKDEAIESRKLVADAQRFDREKAENVRRVEMEVAQMDKIAQQELRIIEAKAELERLETERDLQKEEQIQASRNKQIDIEITQDAARQKVKNDLSSTRVQEQLVKALPQIAENLPKLTELKALSFGGSEILQILNTLSEHIGRVGHPNEADGEDVNEIEELSNGNE